MDYIEKHTNPPLFKASEDTSLIRILQCVLGYPYWRGSTVDCLLHVHDRVLVGSLIVTIVIIAYALCHCLLAVSNEQVSEGYWESISTDMEILHI